MMASAVLGFFATHLPAASFIRGDVTLDGKVNISDAINAFRQLFLGADEAPIVCEDALDADDSGTLEVTDGIYLITSLFLRGQLPPEPFPQCGEDPTEDDLSCEDGGTCGRRALFLIADRSPGMRGLAFTRQRNLMLGEINDLADGDELFVAFYDAGVIVWPATDRAAVISEQTRAEARAFIESIRLGAGTCAGRAIQMGLEIANNSTASDLRMIVFGDGCPTCPGKNGRTYPQETVNMVRALTPEGMTIDTVFLGNICDVMFSQISELTGGRVVRL